MKRILLVWLYVKSELWLPLKVFLDEQLWIRRLLLGLLVIIFALNIIQAIGLTLAPKPEIQNQIRLTQYTKEAQSQLQRINVASRKILDTLSTNTYLPFYSQYMSQQGLNLFLQDHVQQWLHSINDSIIAGDVGLALYDRSNILRGWCSASINAPSFDTVFMQETRFARRSSVTYIDSDAMNLWFVQARKMIDIDGKYIGCSLLKYRLATSQSINGTTYWKWNDHGNVTSLSVRYPFQQFSLVDFSGPPSMLLYVDSNDRSNPIGYFNQISIGSEFAKVSSISSTEYVEGVTELLIVLILLLIFPVILFHDPIQRERISLGSVILFICVLITTTVFIIVKGAVEHIFVDILFSAKIIGNQQEEKWVALWVPIFIFGYCIYLLYRVYKMNSAFSTHRQTKITLRILLLSILPPFIILLVELLSDVIIQTPKDSISIFTMGLILFVTYVVASLCFTILRDLFTKIELSDFTSTLLGILILAFQITTVILFSNVIHYGFEWDICISSGLLIAFFTSIRSSKNATPISIHPIIKIGVTYLVSSVFAIILLSERDLNNEIQIANKSLYRNFLNINLISSASQALIKQYVHYLEQHSDTSKVGLTIQSYFFWKNQNISNSGFFDFATQINDPANGELLLDLRSNSGKYQPIDSATATSSKILSNSQYDLITTDTATLKSQSTNRRKVIVTLGLATKKNELEFSSLRMETAQWNTQHGHSPKVLGGLFTTSTGIKLLGNFPDSLHDELFVLASKKKRESSGEITFHAFRYYYHLVPSPTLGEFSVYLIPMFDFSDLQDDLALPLFISLYFLIFISITIIILRMIIRPRQSITLQDKLVFTSLIVLGCCFMFTHSLMVKNTYSEVETTQTDHFARQRTIASMESYITFRNDSLVTFEKRLKLMALTLNCDLAIYNENNILISSSCPSLFNLSILPKTLPLDTKSHEHTHAEVLAPLDRTILYSISPLPNTIPLGRGYKLLLLQQLKESHIPRSLDEASVSFFLILMMVLSLISYYSQRFAQRITALRLAMDAISKNDPFPMLPEKSFDEMGGLIQSVDAMNIELSKGRDRVVQTEREGAWKEMARQVAHEIKNPLTPMKLSIQHMQYAFEHQDTNFQSIFRRVQRTLSEQIDVLTRIATEFARFGEMPRRRYGFISLSVVLESALALFDAERSRIRFAIDIPKTLPTIYADEEEFRRTLVNLIKNAIQAIDKWGVIVIKATEDSGLIHLQITDSGNGMKEDTLQKAFDPNFSTKTSGMGLGLAIVKRTITDMSGTIRVESKAGVGTTFYIELPARDTVPG